MFRVIFFILIAMSSIAFAQTEENNKPPETPKAIKFGKFEKATNGNVKMIMDTFYVELNNNPAAQAYIINYGSDKETAKREKQIKNSIVFCKFDAPRITFVRGGYREVIKTDLWLVPPGAEPPIPLK